MKTAIVWFRRDLRLTDNPALEAALGQFENVVALYIHAPDEEAPWAPGAASRWWLHHSLAALSESLAARGGRLRLERGDSGQVLLQVARQTGAQAVFWNRLYEPALVRRDTAIKQLLTESGLQATSCNGALLFEPWTVKTGSGGPYKVFTPFWRSCQRDLSTLVAPRPAPTRLSCSSERGGIELQALELLPRIRWDVGMSRHWQPGEVGALARLDQFVEAAVLRYDEDRNRPDRPGSSRLSPHLHFGELSPRQALAAASRPDLTGSAGAESFIRELGWREFAHHLLYHFPHTTDAPLDGRFTGLEWQDDPAALAAWQRGRTGFPIVDAGMRELWETGWMHNRVRMIVASLLTKNLFMRWQDGARWFWDTLVDADLAANTLGWQWTAGCGADAAPYYRVFNPVLQAEKFDPERQYLRRWLPELAALPDKWLARPWEAPSEVLGKAGVTLGNQYPLPVVDPRGSRDDALRRFERLKSMSRP
ncbi:MAG: cryptochrome/photolyase family protein [Steroidobacteraceae bacterium]